MMNTKLKNCLEEFLKDYMTHNPILASHLGLEEYDESMPGGTRALKDAHLIFLRDAKNTFLDLGKEPLSFDEQIDIKAMLQMLEENIFEEEELSFSRSFPDAAMTVSAALYTIFSRDFSPIEERLDKLQARLSKIPQYLESTKECVENPVDLWTQTAIISCQSLPPFIDDLNVAAVKSGYPDINTLSRTCDAAKEAVSDYVKWLQNEILPRSRSNFAIGVEKFEKLLSLKKFGMDSKALIELGSYYLVTIKDIIKRISKRIDPDLTYEEMKELIRSDHPKDFDETLDFCRAAMAKTREFVMKSDFAVIPAGETLEVRETPEIFRHNTPLAAYIPPGRFQKDQRGVYLVTRTDSPDVLKDFSYTALFNKSIHECYPGHHLQFVCANLHPSIARIFTAGTEFVEGWAHYCEDYVAQHGFADDLRLHFTMNLELIWKACRIIIDVKLSRGEMSVDEAVKMLMEEAGFTRTTAETEVHHCTYTPSYKLSYLLGKHLILTLRDELKSRHGTGYTDKKFHNLFLYSGFLPMNLMTKVAKEAFENVGAGR